ncbi:hypothetical protein BV96_04682 [Sphingomonas paucimobilis]|nr:hypothetical protein BV96_04682 [Sphingomonas paucimobilis]
MLIRICLDLLGELFRRAKSQNRVRAPLLLQQDSHVVLLIGAAAQMRIFVPCEHRDSSLHSVGL